MEVLKLIKTLPPILWGDPPAECRTNLPDSGKMMLKVVTAVTYWGGIICSELLLLYSIVCMKTNKAGVRRNIQHLKWFQQSLLPCMNYWLDWDKNTDNRESIFNQGTQPFSTDEGEICLHYYCTGASLFVWAWFHHTFSKWQKGKLIL